MIAESKGVIEGINATMAIIEFTPEGKILTANENFLLVMEYNLREIVGEHHRKFVPPDVQASDGYKIFWRDLAAGKPTKGVFKRITASAKTVWLNAIYNPILNANGNTCCMSLSKLVTKTLSILRPQPTISASHSSVVIVDLWKHSG
jgi:methyl-accepting chemotaxis protein